MMDIYKRIITALLASILLCVISFCSQEVYASDNISNQSEEENDFVYDIQNNMVIINKYIGSEKKVIIPETINGAKVFSIANSAFANCTSIEEISLPKTLKFISNNTFENCTSLKSVDIPYGVSEISMDTFYNCTNLENVSIPNTITCIRSGAFSGCYSLKKIYIPASVTFLEAPFQGLSHIVICSDKNSYSIKYAKNAGLLFEEKGQEDFEIKNERNGDFEYINCNSGIEILKYLGNDNDVVIPDYIEDKPVSVVGFESFKDNNNIKSVKMPQYVNMIDYGAFSGCTNLKSIKMNENLKIIKEYAFKNCHSLSDTALPESLEEIKSRAFMGCISLQKINILQNVGYIESDAFDDCKNLQEINVSDNNFYYKSIDGILYLKGSKINLQKCPEGYINEILYLNDDVNYIRLDSLKNTNIKYIIVQGHKIDIAMIKEEIISDIIQNGYSDVSLIDIDSLVEYYLYKVSKPDDSSVSVQVSFNIYDSSEGKVLVFDNEENVVESYKGGADIYKLDKVQNIIKQADDKDEHNLSSDNNKIDNTSFIKNIPSSNLLLNTSIVSSEGNNVYEGQEIIKSIKEKNDNDLVKEINEVTEDTTDDFAVRRDNINLVILIAIISFVGIASYKLIKHKERCG